MTGETASETEPWIAKHGAKYAYAYDKGNKLKRYFGIGGIPAAVLVDASGTVVWAGHPAELPIEALQKSLAGALPKPLWDWTPASKPVQAALLKRNYAKALEEAAKLSEADGGPEIKTSIQGIVQARVEGLRRSYEAGDFLGADTAASTLVKDLDGLPEKEVASKILADVKANKDAQPVIKAQKQIAKLRAAGPSKRKEIEKAVEDLLEIQSEHPGTFAAKESEALIAELRKKLGSG